MADSVENLKELNLESYQPDATTPLLDALGFTFNKLKKFLIGKEDYKVLVTIMTDGEENASREYSGSTIKKMVEDLKEEGWTFTYIGTDHDVEKIAVNLSINNMMLFEKSEAGIQDMFFKEREARLSYYKKMEDGQVNDENYFKK